MENKRFIDEVIVKLEETIDCMKKYNTNSDEDVSNRNETIAHALAKLSMLFDGDCSQLRKSDNKKYKSMSYMNQGFVLGYVSIRNYEEALECFNNAKKYTDDDETLGMLLLNIDRTKKNIIMKK